jgi:hypothetical protein
MTRLEQMGGGAQLAEFLAADHAKLQLYLGAAAFSAISRRYASKFSQLDPSVRWFSRNLPKFLGETVPYSKNPELAELACLETALNGAFEAPDAPVLSTGDFATLENSGLGDCTIAIHPSVKRLCFAFNTTSLWAALQCGEVPPHPERLDAPQELLVWRQGTHPRFRMLGTDEALALDLAMQGKTFGQICKALSQVTGHEETIESTGVYLRGWVEAEIVAAIHL